MLQAMRYQKASEILPVELVKLIQDYIDGEYVYIPRKQENKKNWGEASRTREELRLRNMEIFVRASSSIMQQPDMFTPISVGDW